MIQGKFNKFAISANILTFFFQNKSFYFPTLIFFALLHRSTISAIIL